MDERQFGSLARTFDWNLIKSFLAVVEEGTLLAASQKIGASQPTLTRHINELEENLGVVLFERGRSGAKPTEIAYDIYEYAREIFSATHSIALAASGKSQQISGTVRITASQIVANFILPPIISRLLVEVPEVAIELVATDQVEKLSEREADIAIRMVRPHHSDLVAKKVNEISLGIYAAENYMSNTKEISEPAHLGSHVVIGYDSDDRIIVGMADMGLQVERDFFRFRCDDQVACWHALCAGMGIGFAPHYLARTRSNLNIIAPELPMPTLPVWLVTHRQIKSNRRIRTVFDYLSRELSALKLDFRSPDSAN